MREQAENETPEEPKPVDSYGDVALGVECAWPQSIPAMHATPLDLSP